jgi:hypothetical protein
MKKSKSRAIRRRSARKIRGGAHEIIIPKVTNIAPLIKPLILAAIISSIMHQTIQESTAMFTNVLSIIAHHLTVKKIELIFPDASTTEIKSMIDMLNGKSTSFHLEPATPVIEGGSRRRNKRLRSKTHKHQIQYGGNKKLIYMVVLFISACFFIYMGIIGMTTRHEVPSTEFDKAGGIISNQLQQHSFSAVSNMDGLIIDLFNVVKSGYMPPSKLMHLNSQEFHDNLFKQIYDSKEVGSIMDKITQTLQQIIDSANTTSASSSVDILEVKANPIVTILRDIILNKLPLQLAGQIRTQMIYSAIQLIIGSGLGLVFGRSLLFLFRDNDDDDSSQQLLHGPVEYEAVGYEAPGRNADPYYVTKDGFVFFADNGPPPNPSRVYNINGRPTYELNPTSGNAVVIHKQFKNTDTQPSSSSSSFRARSPPPHTVSVHDQKKHVPGGLRQMWLQRIWRQKENKKGK